MKLIPVKKRRVSSPKELRTNGTVTATFNPKRAAQELKKVKAKITKTVLLVLPSYDKKYAAYIRNLIAAQTIVPSIQLCGIDNPKLYQLAGKFDSVVFTDPRLLKQLEPAPFKSLAPAKYPSKIFDYQGSYWNIKGTEFLCIDQLKYALYDTAYIVRSQQYLAKLLSPEIFQYERELDYDYWKFAYDTKRTHKALDNFLLRFSPYIIAISADIETRPHKNSITLSGYTFIIKSGDNIELKTIVIPAISEDHMSVISQINSLPFPKIMHNGDYDNSYYLRWGVPCTQWNYDTQKLFHSWFHDFRKSLGHVAAFCVKNSVYWKEEGRKTVDEEEKVLYNARDCHYTAQALLFMMQHAPSWAWEAHNYKVTRAHKTIVMGIRGFKVDKEVFAQERAALVIKRDSLLRELQASIGYPNFNPNSPAQAKRLLEILVGGTKGAKLNIKGADEKTQDKVKALSEFNFVILELFQQFKKTSKLVGTYYDKELSGDRLLFSINTTGTTSDRWSSSSSAFWGTPPVGKSGKLTKPKWMGQAIMIYKAVARKPMVADDGMILFSIDLPSSEAYFSGHLSGDINMLDTLYNMPDFHCANASKFFGIPFEKLYDTTTGTVLNKAIRQLAKKPNHGFSYNMEGYQLAEEMGAEHILMARELLNLPTSWTLPHIGQYLINSVKEAYYMIKGSSTFPWKDSWHGKLCEEVHDTGRIVTPLGFTKQIFGNPIKTKTVMNNLASVKPQNLSAEYLHRGMDRLQAKYEVAGELEIIVAIHDELVGQISIGSESYYGPIIRECLTETVLIGERPLTLDPGLPIFGHSWYDIHD